MSKKFILINKTSGTFNSNNPIVETDLFEIGGGGDTAPAPAPLGPKIPETKSSSDIITDTKKHVWYNCTGSNMSLTIDYSESISPGDEIEGSNTSSTYLNIINHQGLTPVIPTGFTNQIEPGGVFGIKFLTSTKYVLFGTLKMN